MKKEKEKKSALKKLRIIVDDITTLKVDAIVNAANRTLLGGGGVDFAIHHAAGPELLKECRTLHGCATGKAKLTKGYNLPAKYVIHTVGPVYDESNDNKCAKLLASCYKSCLDLAKANNIHSIAFPSISTGIYSYPKDKAARIALKTIKEWFNDHNNDNYEMRVTMCCYNKESLLHYDEVITCWVQL